MNLAKLNFLRGEEPRGREYVCICNANVEAGDAEDCRRGGIRET